MERPKGRSRIGGRSDWPYFRKIRSVRSKHERNRDGTYHSCLIAKTVANPKPGSDEIGRAFEDGWIPGTRSLTFIGEVVAADGRRVNELFIVDADSAFIPRFFDMGDGNDNASSSGSTFNNIRITRFADIPGHRASPHPLVIGREPVPMESESLF